MPNPPPPLGNIKNRSFWQAWVRARPEFTRQFSYPQRAKALAYAEQLRERRLKAKLIQLVVTTEICRR